MPFFRPFEMNCKMTCSRRRIANDGDWSANDALSNGHSPVCSFFRDNFAFAYIFPSSTDPCTTNHGDVSSPCATALDPQNHQSCSLRHPKTKQRRRAFKPPAAARLCLSRDSGVNRFGYPGRSRVPRSEPPTSIRKFPTTRLWSLSSTRSTERTPSGYRNDWRAWDEPPTKQHGSPERTSTAITRPNGTSTSWAHYASSRSASSWPI